MNYEVEKWGFHNGKQHKTWEVVAKAEHREDAMAYVFHDGGLFRVYYVTIVTTPKRELIFDNTVGKDLRP